MSKPVQVAKSGSVWMVSPQESAARCVAILAMRECGLDVNDFRVRDKVITAIAPTIEAMLDYVYESSGPLTFEDDACDFCGSRDHVGIAGDGANECAACMGDGDQ